MLADIELDEINTLKNGHFEWDNPDWKNLHTSPGDDADISFLLGSCRYLSRFLVGDNRGDKTFRSALTHINQSPVDALIMVGDQIYADDLWKIDPG